MTERFHCKFWSSSALRGRLEREPSYLFRHDFVAIAVEYQMRVESELGGMQDRGMVLPRPLWPHAIITLLFVTIVFPVPPKYVTLISNFFVWVLPF